MIFTSRIEPYKNLAKKNIKENESLKVCIPSLTLIVSSAIFVPKAAVGIGIGTTLTILKLLRYKNAITFPFVKTVYVKDKMDTKKYNYFLTFSQTFLGPLQEELIFRGILQPLLFQSLKWLIPRVNVPLFGPIFSLGRVVSICASAIIFGLIHKSSTWKWSVISGLAYGALAANYGLSVSIISHMTQNTIVVTLENLFCGNKTQVIKV